MKRFLALLLSAVLLTSVTVPAFAEEYNGYGYNGYEYSGYEYNGHEYNGDEYDGYGYNGYEDEYNNDHAPAAITAYRRTISGYVGEITQVGYHYEVKIIDDTGYVAAVSVPVTGGFIFDYATGLPALLSDHGYNRVIVVTNYENDALAFAINVVGNLTLHTVEGLQRFGDILQVKVAGGSLVLTLTRDTVLLPWLTHREVTLDEFQVGDEVVFWNGVIDNGSPAQAYPSRAMRLVKPAVEEIEKYEEYEEAYEEEYHHPYEAHELLGGIVRGGVNLYRVNLNAEAAGYNVHWNNYLRRAELTTNDTMVTLGVDTAFFYVNGEAFTMSAPSLLEGGRMFAPADFFARL